MRLQLNDMHSDGGTPEKTTDFVGLLYRPAYYGIVVDQHGDSTEGVAEVAAAKHRFGPAGTLSSRSPSKGKVLPSPCQTLMVRHPTEGAETLKRWRASSGHLPGVSQTGARISKLGKMQATDARYAPPTSVSPAPTSQRSAPFGSSFPPACKKRCS